ncbi:MAG: Lrp/AsnC family transcriptional regulator [Candidatus Woesearchaeota archaeon]
MVLGTKKEILLLTYLRNNARESLTKISRFTKIPVSTIFDRIKAYQGTLIRKHTTLLNFQQLGFDIKLYMLFKIKKDQKTEFFTFLFNYANTNSLFRVNSDFDFMVELIFKDMKKLSEFNEQIEKFQIEERREFFILEDIKRESFLTNQIDIDFLF